MRPAARHSVELAHFPPVLQRKKVIERQVVVCSAVDAGVSVSVEHEAAKTFVRGCLVRAPLRLRTPIAVAEPLFACVAVGMSALDRFVLVDKLAAGTADLRDRTHPRTLQ